LFEQSLKIAVDYLVQTGELRDPQDGFEFIGRHISQQMNAGQTSPLMLSNLAIIAYQNHVGAQKLHLVS
jgi:hypothetical protein